SNGSSSPHPEATYDSSCRRTTVKPTITCLFRRHQEEVTTGQLCDLGLLVITQRKLNEEARIINDPRHNSSSCAARSSQMKFVNIWNSRCSRGWLLAMQVGPMSFQSGLNLMEKISGFQLRQRQ